MARGNWSLPPWIRMVSAALSGMSADTFVCCAMNSIDTWAGSELYSLR